MYVLLSVHESDRNTSFFGLLLPCTQPYLSKEEQNLTDLIAFVRAEVTLLDVEDDVTLAGCLDTFTTWGLEEINLRNRRRRRRRHRYLPTPTELSNPNPNHNPNPNPNPNTNPRIFTYFCQHRHRRRRRRRHWYLPTPTEFFFLIKYFLYFHVFFFVGVGVGFGVSANVYADAGANF